MGGRHSRTQGTDERPQRAARTARGNDLLQSAGQQRAYRRDPSVRPRAAESRSDPSARPRREEPQESARARWAKGGALVLLIAAVCAILLVFLRTCNPSDLQVGDEKAEPVPQSPYDASAFRRDGTRLSYIVDGRDVSRLGIDVSESQLWIDWQAVADDGIDFAMIRAGYRGATEGQLYTDEYFFYNLEAARAAGIDCGVYFFSQATTVDEAVEEADYVLGLLDGAALAYPIAFDSEEFAVEGVSSRLEELTRGEMTSIADAFCKRVEQAGYETMIYGNAYDLGRYNKGNWEGDGVWWAEYGVGEPSVTGEISMWQYSNSGQVAGIETAVDMNIDLRRALDAQKPDNSQDVEKAA